MTKHTVGVANGNFRSGAYYRYAREVNDTAPKYTRSELDEQAHEIIKQYMGEEGYLHWWMGVLNKDSGITQAIEDKLREITEHAVEQATALEPEFCSGAEPQETISNLVVRKAYIREVQGGYSVDLIGKGGMREYVNARKYWVDRLLCLLPNKIPFTAWYQEAA